MPSLPRPTGALAALVSAASLAAVVALATATLPPAGGAAAAAVPSASVDPDRFLTDIAPPPPPPPPVAESREDAIAGELLLGSHLIGGAEAARVAHVLVETASEEGDDPLLFLAVISVESGFDPLARSAVGAQGLMQLMPRTALALARAEGVPWSAGQSFDPVANVRLGVRYVAALKRRFGRRLEVALTAYNRGPAATRRLIGADGRLPAGVVRVYAAPVLARYRALARRFGRLPSAASPLF